MLPKPSAGAAGLPSREARELVSGKPACAAGEPPVHSAPGRA